MKRYYIETFGCQMNEHDSEKMAYIFEKQGYQSTDKPENANIVVFNTCSIRAKAEQKFFSKLGRLKNLKKKNSNLKIIVAGCIAQQEGQHIIKRTPYVNHIFGPQNIESLSDIIKNTSKILALDDNPQIDMDLPSKRINKIKALVNVMYGCNNFCSYCVVPYTRGREKSRVSQSIIKEIQELVDKGYKEVKLLGQNVNSYKNDCDFSKLLQKINKINGLSRIRFLTSHPKDLSDDLIYAIRDLDKVCEHIHLPLQSGSSKILNLMNRKYSYEDYVKKIEKLRSEIPNIAITSDIIAGFPQETDEDHKKTIIALKNLDFDSIFAFKFSPRTLTTASNLNGQIDDNIKSERLQEILDIQNKIISIKNSKFRDTIQEILLENIHNTLNNNKIQGRTRTNKIVNIDFNEKIRVGDIIQVRIANTRLHSLEGILI